MLTFVKPQILSCEDKEGKICFQEKEIAFKETTGSKISGSSFRRRLRSIWKWNQFCLSHWRWADTICRHQDNILSPDESVISIHLYFCTWYCHSRFVLIVILPYFLHLKAFYFNNHLLPSSQSSKVEFIILFCVSAVFSYFKPIT